MVLLPTAILLGLSILIDLTIGMETKSLKLLLSLELLLLINTTTFFLLFGCAVLVPLIWLDFGLMLKETLDPKVLLVKVQMKSKRH